MVRIQVPQQGTRLRLASPKSRIVPQPDTEWYPRKRMKFFYVYILQNKAKNFVYIGYTEDLKQRLEEHNSGYSTSTKHYIPLELIHYEAYRNMKDAKRRETYLKTNKGCTTVRTMLKEYFSKMFGEFSALHKELDLADKSRSRLTFDYIIPAIQRS
ncbi:GIY-YIG nuclease family protein, partial [Patescibacteria group bacterium]|nr:GIY-YIG nuclease family protein [Patescibacteria group bacterium]